MASMLDRKRPRVVVGAAASLLLVVSTTTLVPANAIHPDQTTSAAIYRIPYADGTLVDVTRDAHNHGSCPTSGCDRIDMVAYDDNMGAPHVAGDRPGYGRRRNRVHRGRRLGDYRGDPGRSRRRLRPGRRPCG